MKIKTIATSVALIALGSIGSALAGQGENTLNFTLNADVTKTVDPDDVQIRLYDHTGVELPSNSLQMNLTEVLDTADNIVWGSTGSFDGDKTKPEIAPKDIYVLEIYSKDSTISYTGINFTCNGIDLKNGTDTQNVLKVDGCYLINNLINIPYTPAQVPDLILQRIASAQYFNAYQTYSHSMGGSMTGVARYTPLSFVAHLPNWGDDLSNYTPGAYTGSGSMIIQASW